ncbi:hypothetical protein CJ030_MR4G012555 [Morella rubra]|uniref:Uncharacterized protein n=1 Tax=Morella rubra TaxID=262757 RepID=A0A6A1VQV0_9ROSI|nr:hypothetical protein CJ030_MR4G012555 [Morella rubra]
MNRVLHYSVFNSKEEALEHPYPEMNKEEWTCVCDLFASEEFQRRSAINKENRAKLKIVHTSGARFFQRREVVKKSESDEISAALLYKKTHTNKDGMWTSEDARENFPETPCFSAFPLKDEQKASKLDLWTLMTRMTSTVGVNATMKATLEHLELQVKSLEEEIKELWTAFEGECTVTILCNKWVMAHMADISKQLEEIEKTLDDFKMEANPQRIPRDIPDDVATFRDVVQC